MSIASVATGAGIASIYIDAVTADDTVLADNLVGEHSDDYGVPDAYALGEALAAHADGAGAEAASALIADVLERISPQATKARRDLARGFVAALSVPARSALHSANGGALLAEMDRLAGVAPAPAGEADVTDVTWGELLMQLAGADGPSLLLQAARAARDRGDAPVAAQLLQLAAGLDSARRAAVGAAAATVDGAAGLLGLGWDALVLAGRGLDSDFWRLPGVRWIAPERAARAQADEHVLTQAIVAFYKMAGQAALNALKDPEAAAQRLWDGWTPVQLARRGAPDSAAGYGALQLLAAAHVVRSLLQRVMKAGTTAADPAGPLSAASAPASLPVPEGRGTASVSDVPPLPFFPSAPRVGPPPTGLATAGLRAPFAIGDAAAPTHPPWTMAMAGPGNGDDPESPAAATPSDPRSVTTVAGQSAAESRPGASAEREPPASAPLADRVHAMRGFHHVPIVNERGWPVAVTTRAEARGPNGQHLVLLVEADARWFGDSTKLQLIEYLTAKAAGLGFETLTLQGHGLPGGTIDLTGLATYVEQVVDIETRADATRSTANTSPRLHEVSDATGKNSFQNFVAAHGHRFARGFPNLKQGNAIDFVYDPVEDRVVFEPDLRPRHLGIDPDAGDWGTLISPHQQLARRAGLDDSTASVIAGGALNLDDASRLITTENSGHFYKQWSPEVRDAFMHCIARQGIEHLHFPGYLDGRDVGVSVRKPDGGDATILVHTEIMAVHGQHLEHAVLFVDYQAPYSLREVPIERIVDNVAQRVAQAGFKTLELQGTKYGDQRIATREPIDLSRYADADAETAGSIDDSGTAPSRGLRDRLNSMAAFESTSILTESGKPISLNVSVNRGGGSRGEYIELDVTTTPSRLSAKDTEQVFDYLATKAAGLGFERMSAHGYRMSYTNVDITHYRQ